MEAQRSGKASNEVVTTGHWPVMRHETSIGLSIPASERTPGLDFPHFADILAVTKMAAESGFDAVWYADHFSFTGDDGVRGSWDVWTLLSAIAASVPDIHLGPMVACTAYRNPAVIAKMVEMIQDISGGRLLLGLGAGWHKPEYDQFGLPFEPRYTRFEEAVVILDGMLRKGEVDFQGAFYQANKAVNLPRSGFPDGPPFIFGTTGDRMLNLLARYGDGWNTGWGGDTDALMEKAARLDAACEAVGRDPKSIVRTVSVGFAAEGFAGDPKTVFQGTDEEKVALLHELEALGFRHIAVRFDPFSHGHVEQFASVIEAFHNRS